MTYVSKDRVSRNGILVAYEGEQMTDLEAERRGLAAAPKQKAPSISAQTPPVKQKAPSAKSKKD